VTRDLDKQHKTGESGPCFVFIVFLQQPSTNSTKASVIQRRKTKNQGRESPAIVHCTEKWEDSNFEL